MSLTSYQTAPPCNVMEGETLVADHSLSTAIFREPGEPVGLAHETLSSSGNFPGMTAIRLNRLPKQRSALRKPDLSFNFPPPCGGLGSLSLRAACIATELSNAFRTLSRRPTNSPQFALASVRAPLCSRPLCHWTEPNHIHQPNP
jgi:hypothetical protein